MSARRRLATPATSTGCPPSTGGGRSNGTGATAKLRPGDGRPLTIGGVSYVKGLGVHAYSEIRYQLAGICTAFDAIVGVDDEVGANGSVVFNLFGDGTQIYTSGLLTGSSTWRTGVAVPARYPRAGADRHRWWQRSGIRSRRLGGPEADLRRLRRQPVRAAGEHARAGQHAWRDGRVDLNGDGRLDLVAANAGSNAASVWLGNGNGTFGTRVDFPTGPAPKSIAVGDVNRDRPARSRQRQPGWRQRHRATRQRLRWIRCCGELPGLHRDTRSGDRQLQRPTPTLTSLVACWGGSVVSFLRGNGNGTFAAMVNYTVGAAPHSIVARDFNGDGRLDAAVANHDDASVSVLIGRGDGTFNPQVKYPVGEWPHSIRAGDVDGDGRLDLAVANDGSNTISVLRGQVDGTFTASVHYPTGSAPKGVAIADIDGDGLLDLLSANTAGNYPTCCNPGGDTISLLLNAGGGSFTAAQTYVAGTTPFAIATGDFDGDGDLDVATANWHSNDVTILRNDGSVDPPPQLSNVAAGAITSTQATITWLTQRACRHASRVRPRPAIRIQFAADTTRTTHASSHAGRSVAEHAVSLPREEP